jgi:hypothetical protein
MGGWRPIKKMLDSCDRPFKLSLNQGSNLRQSTGTGAAGLVFRRGAIVGPMCRAYVWQRLAPALHPGDIAVMDNLLSHKVSGVREAVKCLNP